MQTRNLLGFLLILLLSSSTLPAQIMLKEVLLWEQIEKSSLVIEGKMLSKKSYWDEAHEKIYTVNTIQVYKVFKGEPISTIEIITPGGVVDYEAQIVNPSLKLKTGDVGVFTLYTNKSNLGAKSSASKAQFKPLGSLQGFYKYNIETDEASNAFSAKKGITSSFYQEIKSYTQTDYIEVMSFNAQSKSTTNSNKAAALAISSFSPSESTAGTKSVLTITGSNFGTVKGNVSFYNADNAGTSFVNALDTQVLTWTDSKITVEVPSEAGTGKIKVIHNDGTAVTSNNNLLITKSQANIIADNLNPGTDVAYQTQLIDDNGSGGYSWQMTTGFSETSGAKEAFLQALKTWSCETQINWDLNESSIVTSASAQHKAVFDGVNTIAFDDSTSLDPDEDLPDTVLGLRTSYYSACSVTKNGVTTLEWYIKEFDIIFDDETNWNYASEVPGATEFDFESVALHELGHCRQLDHVIDTDNIMHYAIAKGEVLRDLGGENIALANQIQSKSTSTPVCDAKVMTDFAGGCALGVEQDKLKEGISVYPNPTRGKIYINVNNNIAIEKVGVFDINGRLISEFILSGSGNKKTINLSNISSGIYFMNIYSEAAFTTKKIILN